MDSLQELFEKAAKLLQETLNEEGAADKKLTSIAEGGVLSAAKTDSDE